MTAPDHPSAEPSSVVRLLVERPVEVDVDVAREALTDPAWLGRVIAHQADGPAVRRIAADLELPIFDDSGPGPVRKSALIDLGPPRGWDGGGLTVTVAWQSTTAAPLFPIFAGELRVSRDRLVLDGRYVPPFGRVGLVIDSALLHFVARRTAQAFLARVAAGIVP